MCFRIASDSGKTRQVLQQHREDTAQNLLVSVINDVRQFSSGEQHDDITLIVAKCQRR
jgi:serine phosphatase RsbU (regulator of sigma subunit)